MVCPVDLQVLHGIAQLSQCELTGALGRVDYVGKRLAQSNVEGLKLSLVPSDQQTYQMASIKLR